MLAIDNNFGFTPNMAPIKRMWDEGKVAIINGIGYPEPDRSHFRHPDRIWHTRFTRMSVVAVQSPSLLMEDEVDDAVEETDIPDNESDDIELF